MPARTLRRKMKTKVKAKTKARAMRMKKRKPARVTKRTVRKVAKKVTGKLVRRAKAAAPKAIGKVVHYYDRIGVAIVELKAPLRLGDMVHIKRGDRDILQSVTSLQINHEPVASAKKGDVIGMKVNQEVHEGALVMPM